MSIVELEGSELGTKEFWDQSYNQQIRNYKSHGDVGEIWFDEDSQNRVVNWITKQDDIPKCAKVVDLGCGNGMFLIELGRDGYSELLGIDYCPDAVKLASTIAKDQEVDIKYKVNDLLNLEECRQLGTFDIVHDKGTYDAVSLIPDDPKAKRELYIEAVHNLMGQNSVFIITSCNWTEEELIIAFAKHFNRKCTIPTPSFKFGGKVGHVVTSVVFTKK